MTSDLAMVLAQQAIKAALEGEWERAIELNSQILTSDETNVEALNRLARAYREIGRSAKAREIYLKVLKIDKLNVIAQKGLSKINSRSVRSNGDDKFPVTGKEFLEEAGKTKMVQLIHAAEKKILSGLDSGDPVKLVFGKHRVCVDDSEGRYLGRLPDDLAMRLVKLAAAGNRYEAKIRSISDKDVRVFLREVFRAEKVAEIASFPVGERVDYVAFTPPDMVHSERPDVSTLEEEGGEVINEDTGMETGEEEESSSNV